MTKILVNNVNGNKVTETLEFVLEECCNCSIPFFMTTQLNRMYRNDSSKNFYCPNGHGQHYTKSDADIEIEKLKNQIFEKQQENDNITNQLLDYWRKEQNIPPVKTSTKRSLSML